jgi:hypothetical protein
MRSRFIVTIGAALVLLVTLTAGGSRVRVTETHVLPVPPIEQRTESWCYAACAAMIYQYFGIGDIDPATAQCNAASTSNAMTDCCDPENAEACNGDGGSVENALMASGYAVSTLGSRGTPVLLGFAQMKQKMTTPTCPGHDGVPCTVHTGSPVISRWYWRKRGVFDGRSHDVLVRGTVELADGRTYVVVNDPAVDPVPHSRRDGETLPLDEGDVWAWRFTKFDANPAHSRVPPGTTSPYDVFDITPPSEATHDSPH